MALSALGYLVVRTPHLADWNTFATDLLGMQQVDSSSALSRFRMDDLEHRLVVENGASDGLAAMGWQVENGADLDAMATRLELAGCKVRRGDAALRIERAVKDLIWCHDPVGNRVEIFHGAAAAPTTFEPGRPISGFRTGPLGMGHVVINVESVDAVLPFYRDVLGFRISDYGLSPYKLYFFHLNGRHHSFAMVGSGVNSLHHFMVELKSLDDVGQGYDLAQLDVGQLAYTLGRHTNDYMTSFYAKSPSGFLVEYGWGGRVIDLASWEPHETFDGPSFWGHERLNLPEAARSRLREMRLDAARRGIRALLD